MTYYELVKENHLCYEKNGLFLEYNMKVANIHRKIELNKQIVFHDKFIVSIKKLQQY